uniref:Uncharacterized protein n=1 Tax=Plectus sambesii TaxID=2011161 RepID=A0A914VD37_9BILA
MMSAKTEFNHSVKTDALLLPLVYWICVANGPGLALPGATITICLPEPFTPLEDWFPQSGMVKVVIKQAASDRMRLVMRNNRERSQKTSSFTFGMKDNGLQTGLKSLSRRALVGDEAHNRQKPAFTKLTINIIYIIIWH